MSRHPRSAVPRSRRLVSVAGGLLVAGALVFSGVWLHGQASQRIFEFETGSAGAPLSMLRAWVKAAEEHRPGEMDQPATTIAEWTQVGVEGVVGEFKHRVEGRSLAETLAALGGTLDSAGGVLRRAVVLHTDIAVASTHELPDDIATLRRTGLHLGAAMELVDLLKRRQPEDPLPVSWYRAALAFLQSEYELRSTPALGDRAAALFPDDPELLLMAGCAREMTASPHVQNGTGPVDEVRHTYGKEEENLQRAADYYRLTLRVAPGSVEARARLGHVLGELGRHQEALETLKPVAGVRTDLEVDYFANLFLGDEYAAAGDGASAREAYARAHGLFPRARSIHLAQSRLARQEGDLESAVAAVREALNLSLGAEPWNRYYMAGIARHADRVLDELRATAGGPPAPARRRP